jgi:hypothetical protein
MRGNNGNSFVTRRYATDVAITADMVKEYGHIVQTGDERFITLTDPGPTLDDREVQIDNAGSGYASVVCEGGMLDGSDGFVLAPGESMLSNCQRIGGFSDNYPYAWSVEGNNRKPKWQDYSDSVTLTWTTADPAGVATEYRWALSDGLLHLEIYITWTDGNGATALTLTQPFLPADVDLYAPLAAEIQIGTGTPTNPLAFANCLHNTGESRTIGFHAFPTCTDGSSGSLRISGVVPMFGVSTYTPTLATTGGSSTSTSLVGLYKIVGSRVFGWIYQVIADGKDATVATYTPPFPIPNVSQKIAAVGWELVNATYSNPKPYLAAGETLNAARLVSFADLSQMTDTQAGALCVAFSYEIADGYAMTLTSAETWDTEPATWVSSLRYQISEDGRYCAFQYSGADAADCNGATSLTIRTPVVPVVGTGKVALNGLQYVGATASDPGAYLDLSQTTPAGRALIRFDNMSTMTDGAAGGIHVSGCFEIAA